MFLAIGLDDVAFYYILYIFKTKEEYLFQVRLPKNIP
jgi:hypothetical protein